MSLSIESNDARVVAVPLIAHMKMSGHKYGSTINIGDNNAVISGRKMTSHLSVR